MSIRIALALLLLSPAIAGAGGAETVLQCGKLIDVNGREVLGKTTVVVEDNRIKSVESGFHSGAEGSEIVDLRAHTCMPGLMDMHVHLFIESNPKRYIERFTLNPVDLAYRSVVYAERTLTAGFTTVRDLGSRNRATSLKHAIDQGWIAGPRIWAAGTIATTGGHADPTNGMRDDLTKDAGPADGVINSPEDARKAVRQHFKKGADLIKITATGGVLSVSGSGRNPQFTEEEIREIVRTADDYGYHVAAHAHGAEGMKRAIRAGVHSIEHGTLMDAEARQLFLDHGTWLIPTRLAGAFVSEKAKIDGYYPKVVRRKSEEIERLAGRSFEKAVEAGVKIAYGTDTGVSPHGANADEFELLVKAGMRPIEVIRSATLHAAMLLGVTENLGTVDAGKLADIVATPENPVEDISVMTKVSFVMKDGLIYKRP